MSSPLPTQLRTRLYPTVGFLLLAPIVRAAGDSQEDSDTSSQKDANTYETSDIACVPRAAFSACPAPANADMTEAEFERDVPACEIVTVDALDHDTLRKCCYVVALSCDARGVGCGCGGRPLRIERCTVHGKLLVGPATNTSRFAPVPRTHRAWLGSWWANIGAAEHASVRSFQAFSNSLRAVGAPEQLRRKAAAAGRDEARHARLALALAGGFLGASVRVAPLRVRPPTLSELSEFANATARDGAAEELRSLFVLAAARRVATEPEVVAALDAVLRDEILHVELSWETLSWACQQGGEAVRNAVLAGLSEPPSPVGDWPRDPLLQAHGCLDTAAIHRAIAAADELIRQMATVIVATGIATETPPPP